MQNNKELLIEEFKDEMIRYDPNWNVIADLYNVSTEKFGERLKSLRKSRGFTQEYVGEKLSYTKQSINKIEKGKNKKIPVDKLNFISNLFSISVAYLLGLIDDDSVHIDKSEYYFWEHPNNKYVEVRDQVVQKRLTYPMATWGSPTERMLDAVTDELKNDYELLTALYNIFKTEKTKRKQIRGIIKAVEKIL
ncbi:MAG: helix-turn-helix transcriptional regulator [Ruminococcaceae bacterium]|nr:helix-turn-helix transcriptional regulator [Oscillospiraceae bacterium]